MAAATFEPRWHLLLELAKLPGRPAGGIWQLSVVNWPPARVASRVAPDSGAPSPKPLNGAGEGDEQGVPASHRTAQSGLMTTLLRYRQHHHTAS